MELEAYKLTRKLSKSNPIEEMRRRKGLQTKYLYNLAMDRESGALLNGKSFKQSPRIFDMKTKDEVHTKITVETIDEQDHFEAGDYLYYDNEVWLCLQSYIFHNLYCKGVFQKCNWELYWLNSNGKLCSQWCIDINATQYNSGEQSDKTMTLGSAQHMLKMQCNYETLGLDSSKRLFLDKRIENPTCYKVTQNDNSVYNYGSKGLCVITVTQTGKNEKTDKLITLDDGRQVWIADYFDSNLKPDDTEDKKEILSQIRYKFKTVFIGRKSTFTASFKDSDGNKIDKVPTWSITSDFTDSIIIEETGSEIAIMIKDNSLNGKSFNLSLESEDGTSATSSITVDVESLV